ISATGAGFKLSKGVYFYHDSPEPSLNVSRNPHKYAELLKYEAYYDSPFGRITGVGRAFIRPDEEFLRPAYLDDGSPLTVRDPVDGRVLQAGTKFHGREKAIDRRR